MKHFVGIVEKEPGSLWSIWFPDCPGCTTAAEDFETAVGQAKDALRLWVDAAADDGGAVILPRTLSTSRGRIEPSWRPSRRVMRRSSCR